MSGGLESPTSADDLYFARRNEVKRFRPFLQGDVLQGIDIAGVGDAEGDEDRLAMSTSPMLRSP